MTENTILNIPELILVISDDNPTGNNLRDDADSTSLYYQLKDVRAQARNNERKALEDGDLRPNPADWRPIIDKAPTILKSQSKDLEVAAWITEALTRTHGYKGLKEGFQLTRELIDLYWDNIHPPEDEDGVETKIAPITGLNGYGTDGALVMPIKCIPITQGRDFGPFAVWEYTQAYETERITDPEKKQQKIDDGALTLEMLNTAASETNILFFKGLKKDIDGCIEEYAQLSASIDRCCVSDPQPTSNIKNALERCLEALMQLAGDALIEIEEDNSETESDPDGEDQASKPVAANNKVDNRKAAINNLTEIATFFRKTEPHSPISYAIEQAIRWSNMPLPQLMDELMSDKGAKDSFFKLTGIKEQQN